jgi:hypothetical protein
VHTPHKCAKRFLLGLRGREIVHRVISSLRFRTLCALCGVLLAACFGGQTGQENPAREPADCAFERTPLQPGDATPLGFTAAQLEADLVSDMTWRIEWLRMGTSSDLTLSVREVRARTLSVSTNDACADAVALEVLVAV